MARTKSQARTTSEEIVNGWSWGALLTGWVPGSVLFLGAADMVMIRQVADVFGVGFFDEDALAAHLGGILGSAIGGGIASELLGAIPVLGWAFKSGGMALKAQALGQAVIEYFAERSPLMA